MHHADVAHFSSRISKYGLASPNRFRVMFTSLQSAVTSVGDIKHLAMMCDQVTIAGRTVQSVMNMEYGLRREVAYNGPTYNPVTMFNIGAAVCDFTTLSFNTIARFTMTFEGFPSVYPADFLPFVNTPGE